MKKTRLAACPACARHVRISEPRCPFCAAPLASAFQNLTARPTPAVRLSRAALYALGVGALSASAAACGGAVSGSGSEKDSGASDAGADDAPTGVDSAYGGFPPDANFAVPYGLSPPPPDAGPTDE